MISAVQRKSIEEYIVRHYRRMNGSAAQRAQVMADLNGVPVSVVKTILREQGIVAEDSSARRYRHVSWEEIRPLYEAGMCDAEIAARFGVCKATIANRRYKLGLPANVRREG